ncbi:MAG: NUDIX hydrolase [Desulfobacterales bacterium]
MNYCSHCGEKTRLGVPPGDDRPRFICDHCGRVHYQNPKIVVGTIPEWENRILLCRRAIEPRVNRWTLPAGYMENGETAAEGAARETMEEACARVGDLYPFAIFDLTFVNQVYMMYRAPMVDGRCAAGSESREVRLFSESEVPWEDLAFAVIRRTLECYFDDRSRGRFRLHTGSVVPDHPVSSVNRVTRIGGKSG